VQIVMGTLAFWLLLGYARPWPVVLVPAILLMPIGVAGFVVAFRRRVPSLLVTGGGCSSGSWSTWSWGQRAATGGCMSC
jgi:hypothetical protein